MGVQISGTTVAIAAAAVCACLAIVCLVLLIRLRRSEAERLRQALGQQAATLADEQLRAIRDFQERLLPRAPLTAAGSRISGRNLPSRGIATDFYDFVGMGKERLLMIIGDINVKGLTAGLIMAEIKGILPLIGSEPAYAASILGRLNEQMSTHLAGREFVAMALALYSPDDRMLSVANAGLPDPMLIGQDSGARPIDIAGPRYPVGIRKSMSYESVTLRLAPGDRVFFFTDGLADARLSGEVVRTRDLDALFTSLQTVGMPHDDDWTALQLECS